MLGFKTFIYIWLLIITIIFSLAIKDVVVYVVVSEYEVYKVQSLLDGLEFDNNTEEGVTL